MLSLCNWKTKMSTLTTVTAHQCNCIEIGRAAHNMLIDVLRIFDLTVSQAIPIKEHPTR